ncbi:MAG: hypothetical protein J0M35_06110 [Candidatus Obscuribacter phosphatis]|uniref:Uncharacterized protein n=1 Tax=Candidatus Obscuribacter phosphatis TaxID=1906157 RepID=A0A8J7P9K9_9BACT|nr:hypothetical protein [Candidatus Obscuribacter phosphatis]
MVQFLLKRRTIRLVFLALTMYGIQSAEIVLAQPYADGEQKLELRPAINIKGGDVIADPETSLPLTPEQINKNQLGTNQAANSQTEKLKAVIEKSNLLGSARLLDANPMTRYRGPRLAIINLKLTNKSNDPVVLLGDTIKGKTSAGEIAAVSADRVIKLDNSILSPAGKAAVAAVSAATLGLAGPIFYEMLTPQENAKRGLGTAIGRDAGRHEIEAGRFNRRVVLPQDATEGWVAFELPDGASIESITLPLLLPPFPANQGGMVTIPVSGQLKSNQIQQSQTK